MDLLNLENSLWILARPTGLPHYDFPFERYFQYHRRHSPDELISVVARVGAILDYPRFFRSEWERGVTLIHSPEQHQRASDLTTWYPLIKDLTPKSIWSSTVPSPDEIAAEIGWPVFIKGARQTSAHRRDLSCIRNADEFRRAMGIYRQDPILHWQDIIVREYVELRPVEDPLPHRIPTSYEFRTFWWKCRLVGWGRYWWQGTPYTLDPEERQTALTLAKTVARRVHAPFLVVDVAQKADGTWTVIECNDGQESGYNGISPISLWRHVLDVERHIALRKSGASGEEIHAGTDGGNGDGMDVGGGDAGAGDTEAVDGERGKRECVDEAEFGNVSAEEPATYARGDRNPGADEAGRSG